MLPREEKAAVRLVVALLLAGWASAQGTTTPNQATNAPNTTPTPAATTNVQNTNTPATNASPNTQSPNTQSTANANTSRTTAPAAGTVSITGVPTSASRTTSGGAAVGGLTDLPTIAGYGIPTAAVPWTGGAPFMYKSDLPEGTVFIAVGALLGAMGAAVLLWRAIVAYSLHRSVKRANERVLRSEKGKLTKSGFGQSSLALGASNMSLDHLPTKRQTTRVSTNPVSSAAARQSSLFFSPTAGSGHPTPAFAAANRSSNYLPSGYYAAPGAAAPGTAQIGSGTARAPYSRVSQYNVSPPSSPGLPPSRGGASSVYHQPSTSSLNLNIPGNAHPGGRAPSANMDELFGNDPNGLRR